MSDVALVLVVILILAIVWRGPKTLPLIGNMLGRGVKSAREEAKAFRADGAAKPTDDKGPTPGA
jgi:Sec-independent protein translocase protein TatA